MEGAVGGLTPEGIATKQFPTVGRRGYDKVEVSKFLADVAAAYQAALDTPERESPRLSFDQLGEEAGALMQAAKEGADSLRRKAEEQAAAILERAVQDAEARMREANLEADRLRNATKRQCEEMVSEAQDRAERLKRHEREMQEKIADLERLFHAFRAEMEASIAGVAEEEAGAEADETAAPSDMDRGEGRRATGIQPKPVFANKTGSIAN